MNRGSRTWAAARASSSASRTDSTVRIDQRRMPSAALSRTLPVKPSVTITSTMSLIRSRPSTLPTKETSGPPSPLASRAWVSLTSRLPLDGSSPMESRPMRGSAMPNWWRTYTAPMRANWTSHGGVHSALAPASTMVVGVVPGTGMGVAMAGRATPLSRPMRSRALAMVAPVLPALTMAQALPSRTASAARTNDESFLIRTLDAGSSCMSMTWRQASTGRPPVSPIRSGSPTRSTGRPSSSDACRAPATISAGARSPPMASTATCSGVLVSFMPTGSSWLSADVDGLATLVPPAGRAHDVGQLGLVALRADAAGRRAQRPVAGPAAAALGFRRLLLRYGHRQRDFLGRERSRATQKRAGAADPGSLCVPAGLRGPRRPEGVEGGPPGVGRSRGAVAVADGQLGPAGRAQPGAVGSAQRGQREPEEHGVAGQRGQVELLGAELVGVVLALLLALDDAEVLVAVAVAALGPTVLGPTVLGPTVLRPVLSRPAVFRRPVQLPDFGGEDAAHRPQATPALGLPAGADRALDFDAPVDGRQDHVDGDVVVGRDHRVGDPQLAQAALAVLVAAIAEVAAEGDDRHEPTAGRHLDRSWSKKASLAMVSSADSAPAMSPSGGGAPIGVTASFWRPAATVLAVRSRTISKAANFWSQ